MYPGKTLIYKRPVFSEPPEIEQCDRLLKEWSQRLYILLAAYFLPLRLFPFQILGLYLHFVLFYGALKYSICLIQTNISDYSVTPVWCL